MYCLFHHTQQQQLSLLEFHDLFNLEGGSRQERVEYALELKLGLCSATKHREEQER